ncbi:TOMM precursor leader peptide-binding protein [Nocardiopsis kunsanensis]|uniref:TOMM precursor leader peptide-binding protein n=1 Tax=Nocardiopsis kunsanensis TaxID=141693 RepID=UPI000344E955|nr:TOMM precursor leader peptide-binding protein [Nocardiopsis kunsanensis]
MSRAVQRGGAHTPPERVDDPLERSRKFLEEALRPEAVSFGPGTRITVGLLGERDLLWDPDERWWAEMDAGQTCLPVLLYDTSVLVGPVVGHGSTRAPGCAVCLARRWQQLRPDEDRDALEHGSRMGAPRESPFITGFGIDTVRAVIASSTSDALRGAADVQGNRYVRRVDLTDLSVRRHPLLADAHCPLCGGMPDEDAQSAELAMAARPETAPGSSRTHAVSEYTISEEALANPVCGALAARGIMRLGNTTTAPTVGYVSVRGSGYLHPSFWGGHADTYAASLRLGLLEGMERQSGLLPRNRRPAVRGSYRELADEALDPRELGTYDDRFYEHNPGFQRFSEDTPLTWVRAYSLGRQRPVLVPEVSVYYHGNGDDKKIVQECSNGCATGGSPEEAALHGLLERIERDAFLLAWYGQLPTTEIDADSWRSRPLRWLIRRLALYGYRARFFDARPAFDVPVVVAVAERVDGGPGTLCFGASAAPDPEAAAEAALRETAYEVPHAAGYAAHSRQRLLSMAADFTRIRELADHPRLYGLPEMRTHADHFLGPRGADRETVPAEQVYEEWYRKRPHTGDLTDDLRYCRDELARAGFDTLVVDQTSPEQRRSGVHTVCVLTPGLLPIDFGWDRQRALLMPRIGRVARDHGWEPQRVREALSAAVPHPFP